MHQDIRLARVIEPPSTGNNYRGTIEALDTFSRHIAICNPSPYGWAMPEKDAIVYFKDTPYTKRILGVLHDTDTSNRSLEDIATSEELVTDPTTTDAPIGVLNMDPGDVYWGKYGRITFLKNGDVRIVNKSSRDKNASVNVKRCQLYFDDSLGLGTLSCDNVELKTSNSAIRVRTEASSGLEGATGDLLHLERNGDNGTLARMTIGATDGVGFINLDITGTFKLDASGDANISLKNLNIAASDVLVEANSIVLGGDGALALVIAEKLINLYNTHVHITGAPGAPCTVPTLPLTEAMISTQITTAK